MRSSVQAGAPAGQVVWVLVVDHESEDVIPPVVCATDDLAKRQARGVAESYDLSSATGCRVAVVRTSPPRDLTRYSGSTAVPCANAEAIAYAVHEGDHGGALSQQGPQRPAAHVVIRRVRSSLRARGIARV
jgi:hypothetical protein